MSKTQQNVFWQSFFFYNFASEMAKNLKNNLMIFALGMFIVPNQIFFKIQKQRHLLQNRKIRERLQSSSKNLSPCHDKKIKKSCNSNCAKFLLIKCFLACEETDKSLEIFLKRYF